MGISAASTEIQPELNIQKKVPYQHSKTEVTYFCDIVIISYCFRLKLGDLKMFQLLLLHTFSGTLAVVLFTLHGEVTKHYNIIIFMQHSLYLSNNCCSRTLETNVYATYYNKI